MGETNKSPDTNVPQEPEKGLDPNIDKSIDVDDDPNLVGRPNTVEIDPDDDPDLIGPKARTDIDPDDDPDLVGRVGMEIDPDDDPDLVSERYSSDIDPDDDPDLIGHRDPDLEESISKDKGSSDTQSAAQVSFQDSKPEKDSADMSEALQETDSRMDQLTNKYAEQVAERSKSMFERKKTTTAAIDASKEELTDLIGAIATEMYDDLEADGLPQDEIVKQIDSFVAEQTDKVVSQMEANRVRDYENSSPIKKAMLDTWSSWGDTKMGKVKKALVFAVPSAAVGAVAMPFIGAIGAGAGIATGAFVVGRSIGRRIAGAKLDEAANAKNIGARQSAEIRSDIAGNEDASHQDILDLINERSKEYRNSNRNRMMGGTAIALTVGLGSGTLSDFLADHVDFGKIGEKISDAAGFVKDKYDAFQADRRDGGLIDSDILGEGPDSPDTSAPAEVSPDTGGSDGGVDNGPAEAPAQTGRETLFDGFHASRELTPEGQEALLKELNNYQVKSGDTIWDISEKMLEEKGVKNPSVYEIDATKDFLLQELQSQGYADSRGWLNAGDTIKLR